MFKNTRVYINFTQAYILLGFTAIIGAFGVGAYKQSKKTGRRWLVIFCEDVRNTVNAFKGKGLGGYNG